MGGVVELHGCQEKLGHDLEVKMLKRKHWAWSGV